MVQGLFHFFFINGTRPVFVIHLEGRAPLVDKTKELGKFMEIYGAGMVVVEHADEFGAGLVTKVRVTCDQYLP